MFLRERGKQKNKKGLTVLKFFFVAFFVVAGYFLLHYIGYGSFTRNCIYTEKEIPVPPEFAGGKIVVFQKAYQAIGKNVEASCLPILGKIDKQLVGPETMNNLTIGRGYFEERGQYIADVEINKMLRVERIFAVTKHGINTIDSGPGPIHYLVLSDDVGELYQIATVSLGSNKGEEFLNLVLSSGTYVLSPFVFGVRNFNFQLGDSVEQMEEKAFATDYDALQKNCDSTCCNQSIEHMRRNEYPRFIGRCPKNYKQNSLVCMQSITWCEPEDISTVHE